MMDQAEVPLYIVEKDEEQLVLHRRNVRTGWKRQILQHFVVHLALLAISTTIMLKIWSSNQTNLISQIRRPPPSPANSVVQWEWREFENSLETDNPYKGPPTHEYERAWNQLLSPMAIRVSGEDLKRINRSSIPIADGSGYMAGLDVHHQLHCIRWVRQMLHKEHYNMTFEKEKNLGQHVDHCLDALRQFIMCKADVVLITYDWLPNFHAPWPNFEVQHECFNWNAIQTWAKEHTFDGFDPILIKHPNFHPELGSPFSYGVSGNSLD